LIIENLAYCQQHKNLNIHAYAPIALGMTNHIHTVANIKEGSLSEVLGRFKTYTSKKLFEIVSNNTQESRRDWIIKAFERFGKYNPANEDHPPKSGQNGNYPYCFIRRQLLNKR
jgi:REP element-mobilizing transposase RayT